MFCVGSDRTLALLIHPDRPQPSKAFAEITEQRLQELLPAEQGQAWNIAVSNALPELSDKFAPAIEEAARGCKVLYIVAQPQLSRIPFAALSFRDGSPLVSRCAVASAPSATALKLLLSRPKALGARTCLAIGVGSEAHYRFEDQAKAIRALGGWEACDVLEPASSKEAWLKAAPHYSTLFLACHGTVDPGTFDGLASSRLALADGERLTARDVFFELNGRLQADLVFLNACASGRFQSRLHTETSGFGAAFLRAGARSVIAAVGYIEPGEAQELAVEFFRRWLGGNMSKAAALQQAQLKMHENQTGACPISWASYMLIGDYR
jgi:CHAT domain-containing protein